VNGYRVLLEQAGFVEVIAEDHTADLISIMRSELARIADDPAHTDIRQSWLDKIERARRDEQAWIWCAGRVA